MSKKIYKRSNENQKFLQYEGTKNGSQVKSLIQQVVSSNANDENLELPLPSKKEIKHAKCPHCGNRVTLFTLKYQKIEIIKNNKRLKI